MALIIPRYNNSSEFHVTSSPLVAFEEAQKSGKPIFLEFYAKWWPSCRSMEPVVLALEKDYIDKTNFIVVDIDDPQGQILAKQFDIYYIPAFFVLMGYHWLLREPLQQC